VLSVYVAGPLMAAVSLPAAREYYETLAGLVEAAGLRPVAPHLETDPKRAAYLTPTEVWSTDKAKIDAAGAVLAHVGQPSSGVGAELAYAAHRRKPIIALWRPGEAVSKLLLGLLREHGAVEVVAADAELEAALAGPLAQLATRTCAERAHGGP
jgi:nucleoside 2-deoxyribosyltransferase